MPSRRLGLNLHVLDAILLEGKTRFIASTLTCILCRLLHSVLCILLQRGDEATRRRGEEAKRRRGNRNRTASFLPDDELRTLSAATAQPLPAHDLWTLTHLTLCLAPSWTTRFRRHPESSESLRPLKRPEALFLLNAVG